MCLSKFVASLAASLCLLAASSMPAFAGGAETLSGQVLFDDGLPAPAGVSVTLRFPLGTETTALTTDGGRFTFSGLAPGNYTLVVTRDCAATVSRAVTVPSTFVTLEIAKNKLIVKGTVALADAGGGDQSGTSVSLSQAGTATLARETGPLGEYTFGDLCGGAYQVAASRRGYLPATASVSASAPVTVVPAITLAAATFSISGSVTLAAGGDASGVVVSLAGTTLSATSGSGGAFHIDAVPAGVYTLGAKKSGLAVVTLPALVVAADVVGLVLHMTAPPPVVQQKAGCAQAGDLGDAALLGLALLIVGAALLMRRRQGRAS